MDSNELDEDESPVKVQPKNLTRKLQKHPKQRACNMNKENKNEAHLYKRGNIIPAKTLNFKTLCRYKCSFQCTIHFAQRDIQSLHNIFDLLIETIN